MKRIFIYNNFINLINLFIFIYNFYNLFLNELNFSFDLQRIKIQLIKIF